MRMHRKKEEKCPPAACEADARSRLLSVAERLFAEKGFAETSIRELATQAGVNVAAVNYYFRSKEDLYVAALRHSMRRSGEATPHFEAILADAQAAGTPEAACAGLRRYVELFMETLYNGPAPNFSAALMSHETLHPTEALDIVIEEFIRPKFNVLTKLVIQARPDLESDVAFYCMSVIGQCLHYHFTLPISLRLGRRTAMTPDFVARLSQHIADFSLRALEPSVNP
jgi:AcrR family transcriptional regulator